MEDKTKKDKEEVKVEDPDLQPEKDAKGGGGGGTLGGGGTRGAGSHQTLGPAGNE